MELLKPHSLKKMKLILLAIGILFSAITVLGCSPVYQMKYDYLAPESAGSRECTQGCDNKKEECEQGIEKRIEQNRQDSQKAYQQCMLSQQSSRSPVICIDESTFIQPDYSGCLLSYNRCFQDCGGKVEESRVCISHCR